MVVDAFSIRRMKTISTFHSAKMHAMAKVQEHYGNITITLNRILNAHTHTLTSAHYYKYARTICNNSNKRS